MNKYRFTLDQRTQGLLAKYTAQDWIRLFKDIIAGRSITCNIEFSEQNPETRLSELYDLVGSLKLDEQAFQHGLVMLFQEYYGNVNKNDEVLWLINAIDYIRPAYYYRPLLELSIHPEFDYMLAETTDSGFSLQLYLINTLIRFDLLDKDHSLLQFLMKWKDQLMPPEYYQVAIRYLYRLDNQKEFDDFMDAIMPRLEIEQVMRFVSLSFHEYFFYRSKYTLLFNWFFSHHDKLSEDSSYLKMTSHVFSLLNRQRDEFGQKYYFSSLYVLLSPKNNHEWLTHLYTMLDEQEDQQYLQKVKLLHQLGQVHDDLEYLEPGESGDDKMGKFYYEDGKGIYVKDTYVEDFMELHDAMQKAKRRSYRESGKKSSFLIQVP